MFIVEEWRERAIALDGNSCMVARLPFTGRRIGQEGIRRDWGHRGYCVNRWEWPIGFRLEVFM